MTEDDVVVIDGGELTDNASTVGVLESLSAPFCSMMTDSQEKRLQQMEEQHNEKMQVRYEELRMKRAKHQQEIMIRSSAVLSRQRDRVREAFVSVIQEDHAEVKKYLEKLLHKEEEDLKRLEKAMGNSEEKEGAEQS